MKLSARGIAGVLALSLSLACAAVGNAPKTTVGAVGGSVAGGLLGAAIGGNTKSIAAGAVAGGLVGALAGNVLDQRDRRLASEAAQRAFEVTPSGASVPWTNPDTGNSGSVTPTSTYQTPQGQYCREFTQEIVVGGERRQGFGTACRMPDGTWRVQG